MISNNVLYQPVKITIFTLLLIIAVPAFTFSQQTIPSSQRSREAIKRVAPALIKDFSKSNLQFGAPIFLRIFKKEKTLELWVKANDGFQLFREYKICTYGFFGLGPKTRQGDGKAPEGFYFVKPANMNPFSSYHLSFNLGYPNRYDQVHGRTGGALMVHGKCVSIGCYAMTDAKIEEIYAVADAALRNGQKFFRVHIFPFKMSVKNMEKYENSKWHSFWENLKEGYDLFENSNNLPPNVEVRNGRYLFN